MKKASWPGKVLYYLVIFGGAILVANAWVTRNHVSGAVPDLPVDQRIYTRSPSTEFDDSRPTLIYFYASWCGVCKADMPALESIAGRYPVIAVAMQSGDDQAVLKHRAGQNINLDIINDAEGDITNRFGVQAVPTAFIVKHGDIKFSTQGFSSWIGYWSRMLLAELL